MQTEEIYYKPSLYIRCFSWDSKRRPATSRMSSSSVFPTYCDIRRWHWSPSAQYPSGRSAETARFVPDWCSYDNNGKSRWDPQLLWSYCGHLDRRSHVTDHLRSLSNSDSLVFISVKAVCSWLSWHFFIFRHYFRMCSCVIWRPWHLPEAFTSRAVHKNAPASKRIETVEPDNSPEFSLHSNGYLTGLITHGILGSLLTSACCCVSDLRLSQQPFWLIL
jgi:hypothetical protein